MSTAEFRRVLRIAGAAMHRAHLTAIRVRPWAFLAGVLLCLHSTLVQGAVPGLGTLELTTVFFAEGGRIFGPGADITVSGVVPSIPSYLCPSGGDGEGEGSIFPSADLYVIDNTGTSLGAGAPLTDVLGTPNRVIGSESGAFVEELVAITQPRGNLPAGEYDIVMDQCEDGHFDPGIDIHLGAGPGFAFQVFLPEKPGEIDLSPLKLEAKAYELGLSGYDSPVSLPGALPGPTGPENHVPGLCFGFGRAVDEAKRLNRVSAGVADAAAIFTEACADLAAHYKGIAADPPDPNFTTLADLGAIPYAFDSDATRLERAVRRLVNVVLEQRAVTAAFLTTLERVQGALAADDQAFLQLQLTHLNELINLLIGPGGNLLRFYATLEALDVAIVADSELAAEPDIQAFLEQSRRARRAAARLLIPLGPKFLRDPNQPNVVRPYGLQAWIITYLGLDPTLATAGLNSIAQYRASIGLPPLAPEYPVAMTTGPYTAPPGRVVQFDASPSNDPNGDLTSYAWDLDLDGQFDDGASAQVERAYASAGTRLIGLKVVDAAGHSDVGYTLLRVGDTAVQDVVTIQHQPRRLRRIAPDGTAMTLAEHLIPLSSTPPVALQLDLNGDVLILDEGISAETPFVLYRFDKDGNPVDNIDRNGIAALLGQPPDAIDNATDIRLDGRGRILMAITDRKMAGLFDASEASVIRLAPDFSTATVIAGGFGVNAGGGPSLAIDPDGRVVVSKLKALDDPLSEDSGVGIAAIEPDTGQVTSLVPAIDAFPVAGPGSVRNIQLTFGGANLFIRHGGGDRRDGGIEVDALGRLVVGYGGQRLPLRVYRIPNPVDLVETAPGLFDMDVFPVLSEAPGQPNVFFSDIGIDAGGDYVLTGLTGGTHPLAGHNAVWRLSPVGELFPVADLGIDQQGSNQGGFAFDLTREVRRVTARDITPPQILPSLRLHDLTLDQSQCPSAATVRATLTNSGTTPLSEPERVLVYDGDPLIGGAVIGAATIPGPVAPGASVEVSVDWHQPAPGTHNVFALADDANATFLAAIICAAAPPDQPIMLQPIDVTLPVGETHTVTARVLDLYGQPLPGLQIDFAVTGSHTLGGTVTTGSDGSAEFSYTGTDTGQDTIIASAADAISNAATVLWQAMACDVDTDSDVDIDDIHLILASRNQPAAGPSDVRDADGDGRITVLDARRCVVQCTRPRCARP